MPIYLGFLTFFIMNFMLQVIENDFALPKCLPLAFMSWHTLFPLSIMPNALALSLCKLLLAF